MSSGGGVCVSKAKIEAARAGKNGSQHNSMSSEKRMHCWVAQGASQLDEISRQKKQQNSSANMQRERKRTWGVFHWARVRSEVKFCGSNFGCQLAEEWPEIERDDEAACH